MVQKKRRTTARRTTKKAKIRRKKSSRATKVAKAMNFTPAQKKKLHQAMRDVERHINTLTRKYNNIVNTLAKL